MNCYIRSQVLCTAHPEIIQSSYFGGNSFDRLTVALFSPFKNCILLAGETTSTNFTQTTNSIQNQTFGNSDGFIAIIGKAGTTRQFKITTT